jgi:hypothetical protein
MRATILAGVAILSITTGAASLRAQESRPELIGKRVRVTVAPADSSAVSRVVVGELVAVGDSALVIRPRKAAAEESVATSGIQRFEVRTGRNRGSGAMLGTLVGLGVGAALGYATGDDCTSTEFLCFDRSDVAVGVGLAGAVLGLGIGLIAGRGDRWRAEAVPARVSVVPTQGGGFRLAASFSF